MDNNYVDNIMTWANHKFFILSKVRQLIKMDTAL